MTMTLWRAAFAMSAVVLTAFLMAGCSSTREPTPGPLLVIPQTSTERELPCDLDRAIDVVTAVLQSQGYTVGREGDGPARIWTEPLAGAAPDGQGSVSWDIEVNPNGETTRISVRSSCDPIEGAEDREVGIMSIVGGSYQMLTSLCDQIDARLASGD